MDTWGVINSFGVFQSYYLSLLGRPPSDISWIGSIQVFLTFFISTFTGRVTDAGFFRPVLLCGTIVTAIGIFTTSVATEYWQLLLSQGICMGIGSGCLFCPAVSTISTYFSKKRSLAIGIAASGSATGGLVFPAMARQLLPTVGFGWAVRAIGFVQLATLLFANVFMKSRLPPRRAGSLVEWGAFKELDYTFYAVGMFFVSYYLPFYHTLAACSHTHQFSAPNSHLPDAIPDPGALAYSRHGQNFLGLYFAFYYISAFSRTMITPQLSYTDSLNLLLVLNGVGAVGRLLPNFLADSVGPLNMLAPSCLLSSICLLAWIAVRTPDGLYAWVVFFGIFGGAIQSLFPAGLSSLTTDLRKQGTRMGMVFTIVSFAVLTGNPIAGALISAMDGRYLGAQLFTGMSMLVGMSFILGARLARMRRTGAGWGVKI
ncbi:hypothetical protein DL766_008379 [Monosporascus sp. MC13-8B]|uniref:Major facilitator superfamily (MFS) profile domain-containing protein n=1 Tax=Monosporascus cannonballus TaxID=155416 RepID=A0ABY0H4Z0_9PEZI|nr:hypothetical protein DL762_005387 [Monosporascus cannonballus]RYP00638.1 hypothetical protein DL763_000692 [Monosporascus cannonballus]RYP19701.1 hypothetical protein DL766_008379 [Monosporascus sp. MC13-8B]